MPTPTSSVRLVTAVHARLAASLPALITAQEMPVPTEILDYHPGLISLAKAPQCWVDLAQDKRSDDPDRGSTLRKYSHDRTVLVGISSAGPNKSVAAKRLKTYADLIRSLIEGDQTAGGEGLWVRWLGSDYSPNMSESDTSLFQEVVLMFDVPRRTTIGTD